MSFEKWKFWNILTFGTLNTSKLSIIIHIYKFKASPKFHVLSIFISYIKLIYFRDHNIVKVLTILLIYLRQYIKLILLIIDQLNSFLNAGNWNTTTHQWKSSSTRCVGSRSFHVQCTYTNVEFVKIFRRNLF